ncbi:DUF1793-domain-containing protein [Obba rivulosa]|uniref:DUF1793-domain-containing protein n=1 Tax=Obba rivulosa TaxID=1052685 RepID=A0A8E2AYC2_9APHY|nr:DUF1793-domain-containing protein [Obba rivulosa]
MFRLLGLIVLLGLSSFVRLQAPLVNQSSWPNVVPVAVRSPYLNCWLFTQPPGTPFAQWPQFWHYPILGWVGLARIDGTTYQWLGDWTAKTSSVIRANLTGVQITPTRTMFEFRAGSVNLNVTYLTPIERSDWVQQSIPFSYLSVELESIDGAKHDVQVYSDISAEWLSGNRSAEVTWETVVGKDIVYHQVSLVSPTPFQEIGGQANDGTMYHAVSQMPNMTYQTGADVTCRGQFHDEGVLTNAMDTDFRGIDSQSPVFGFAVDLGSISSTSFPVVWAVGYVRDPIVQYMTPSGEKQSHRPYFLTQFSSVADAISAFVTNYTTASQRAQDLDQNLVQAAANISSQYVDLVSLAARQAFAGLDITISNGTDGQWNTSDVKIFMKDVGNTGRVNPVEVIYQAFPMFIYLNASFAKSLLLPLLEYQDSSQYNLPYSARDLGDNYPLALGDNAAHSEGIEQTGNMLIMTLAHARISGDGSLISEHYGLLKNWTDYLVNTTLTPAADQQSADYEGIANLTNLAVKGIIAIQAMAEMSKAIGDEDSFEIYAKQASAFIEIWESLALSSDQQHLLLDYGDETTWALAYNLYADRLLGLNLVNPSVCPILYEWTNP